MGGRSLSLLGGAACSAALLPALLASAALAGDLTSSSFRLRGAHLGSLSSGALVAPGPRFSESGVSAGQGDALGFAGSGATLATVAPGFWPIVAGELPDLDLDGDGLAAWLDEDDDGDGLLDAVETNTGLFASPVDTGTDATNPDSDGDGVGDGLEVAAGSNPNDALSVPASPDRRVPGLRAPALLVLALLLAATPFLLRRRADGGRHANP